MVLFFRRCVFVCSSAALAKPTSRFQVASGRGFSEDFQADYAERMKSNSYSGRIGLGFGSSAPAPSFNTYSTGLIQPNPEGRVDILSVFNYHRLCWIMQALELVSLHHLLLPLPLRPRLNQSANTPSWKPTTRTQKRVPHFS
jgi:hypothetical protein